MFGFVKRLWGAQGAPVSSPQPPTPPEAAADPAGSQAVIPASIIVVEPTASAPDAATLTVEPSPVSARLQETLPEMSLQMSCNDYAKAGFYAALLVPEGDDEVLQQQITDLQEPLVQRLADERTAFEAQAAEVKKEIEEIDSQITAVKELQKLPDAAETTRYETELKTAKEEEVATINEITAARFELASARATTTDLAVKAEFEGLDKVLSQSKNLGVTQQALSEEAQKQQEDRWKVRREFLEKKLEQTTKRQDEVAGLIQSEGLIMGKHRGNKVAIGTLVATLLGWVTAILTGRTGFDDNMFLEAMLQNMLRSADAALQGQPYYYRIILFFGLALLYCLMVAILITIHYLMAKARVLPTGEIDPRTGRIVGERTPRKKQNTQDANADNGYPTKYKRRHLQNEDIDFELPLEPDKSGHPIGINGAMLFALAPLWMLGSAIVAFSSNANSVGSGIISNADAFNASELSYSGFLVGFVLAWMLGYAGYAFIFSKGKGNAKPLAWIGAIVGVAVAAYLLSFVLDPSNDKGQTAKVAFALCGAMSVTAMGLGGKILREYFLVNEDLYLTRLREDVSRAAANIASPWSPGIEYFTAAHMRDQVEVFASNLADLHFDDFKTLDGETDYLSRVEQPKFHDLQLAEYRSSDHRYFIELVSKIEALKRKLLAIRERILQYQALLQETRSGKLPWQVSLRDQIDALQSRRQSLRDELAHREALWTQRVQRFHEQRLQVATCLRRGYESGMWYRSNQENIKAP
jgi:hypothetical protein